MSKHFQQTNASHLDKVVAAQSAEQASIDREVFLQAERYEDLPERVKQQFSLETFNRLKVRTYEICENCSMQAADVRERPNAFEQDVNNDPDAVWTVCDECAYQNAQDI